MIGQKISQYLILEKIGEGGMGIVYLAEDTVLGRRVAVKSLKTSNSSEFTQYKTRFLREARFASNLNHPNIVSVYDYGETEEGVPYLVMEYVSGKNLSDILRQKNLTIGEYIEIIKQIAKALSSAHEHGIIHRDVKPSNVFVNERGEVKVLDFGLAKLLDADSYNNRSFSSATSDMFTQTRQGVFMGTPSYSSPEQLLGSSVDRRSDIFSLGAVLYECLSGQQAFGGKNFADICAQVIKEDPVPPSTLNMSIAPGFDVVALKALSKKAENRYQTIDELISDLETAQTNLPTYGSTANRETVRPQIKSSVAISAASIGRIFKNSFVIYAALFVILTIGAVIFVAQGGFEKYFPAQISAEAISVFNEGVDALRNGNYYKARKLFETAIERDDRFPLAHARLAEALIELGYEDRATREILKITELTPTFSELSETDRLALQAIAATVRRNYDGAIENYRAIVEKTSEENKKYAYFDLGRAFEENDETDSAIENFEEAAKRDERFAAAHLMLGMLYGRKLETQKAIEAFARAQNIYESQSDYDGQAEVAYRRGYFLNLQDKLPEASEQMKRALEIASISKSPPLQIRILLQLSSIAYTLSDHANAEKYVEQAIEMARAEQLENLATGGLIDAGNAYFTRGELKEAENKFRQALARAETNEWQSTTARANLSLGSLYLQQSDSGQAIKYIQPALDFYRKNGFKKETLQAQLALGYAADQLGNYDAAVGAFSELLRTAEEKGDKSLVYYAHSAIGLVLIHQEKFSDALVHYDKSLELSKLLGLEQKSGYSHLNRGQILWNLGRYAESRKAIDAAANIAGAPKSTDSQLSAWTHLIRAQSALSENDYKFALSESRKAIDLSGQEIKEIIVQATLIEGLAKTRSGDKKTGTQLCRKAAADAEKTGIEHLKLKSKLALAEALSADNEPHEAVNIAMETEEISAKSGNLVSQWRSYAVACAASLKINDEPKSNEYKSFAGQALANIENAFGVENYKSFISRPDVQIYLK